MRRWRNEAILAVGPLQKTVTERSHFGDGDGSWVERRNEAISAVGLPKETVAERSHFGGMWFDGHGNGASGRD